MDSLKVADFMQRHSMTLDPELSVAAAVRQLLDTDNIGAPVVDSDGHLIGWVSEQDFLASLLESSYYCEQVANVNDVMKKDVLSVKMDDTIIELAQQMINIKPKMYPVVDTKGMFVGLITRRDVLKAIDKQQQRCY